MPEALLVAEALTWLDHGPVDVSLAPGECVCLSGASGSGKTRLLRALADLDPHGGQVRLRDQPAASMPAPAWRRQVAMLPTHPVWWSARVGEHFLADPNTALERIGLSRSVLERDPAELSSGEQQRLALVRALQNRPRILLLDEPTASIDPAGTRRVEKLLADWRDETGGAMLWISHDDEQIRRVARRRLRLAGGRLEDAAA